MKKVLFSLLAVTALFTACNNDDSKPEVNIAITQDMVEVDGVSGDYLVVVDPASKTIAIELAYEDAAELQALTVNFVNLPSGVTAEPLTHNFSNGATAQAVFTKDGVDVTYTVSATIAAADPHFVSATLNEVEVSGGTVKLSGSADLTKVVFEYTVAPEDTKVYIGDDEVASGSEVDFSDKVNGVTFTLKCGEVTKEETIKVTTTGISSVKRVWGHYAKPSTIESDGWYGSNGVPAAGVWQRNVAMDDNNIYIPVTDGTDINGNILVIDRQNGNLVKTISSTVISGGVHLAEDAEVLDNNGLSVLLVCNLVNAKDSHLKVYAFHDINSEPTVVLDYVLTEAHRFGDKFVAEGNWQDGRLVFVDYTPNATNRVAYTFDITNGVINSTPEVLNLGPVLPTANSFAGLYKYSDTEYMYAGTGGPNLIMSASGNTLTTTFELSTSGVYSNPMLDPQFFTFNEQEYISYVKLENNAQDAALVIQELNYATLKESMESADPMTFKKLGIGDPNEIGITGMKNGNNLGGSDLRVIDGKTYIVVSVPQTGISLFELE